jgi:hypothetical protein
VVVLVELWKVGLLHLMLQQLVLVALVAQQVVVEA